jgi:hypothetical protein
MIMLSVAMLNVVMLGTAMLNVILFSVAMLKIVVPCDTVPDYFNILFVTMSQSPLLILYK